MIMYNNSESQNKEGEVKTILGKGTKIKGDIITKGSLRIEGELEGQIKSKGDIFIGEEGVVRSGIEGKKVVIAGKVKGNITAKEKLELLSSGNIIGDITTNLLKIEEGATFVGSSKMVNNKNNENKKIKTNFDKNDSKNKEKDKKQVAKE